MSIQLLLFSTLLFKYYYYYYVYFMPDSVPLFGPCRLLPILGKNPLRGKPIRVFFTSKLAVCISAASSFLFLSPVRHSIHCFRQEDLALFLTNMSLPTLPQQL